MDDIDEHLFMLVRLKGDTGQEIAFLVMPMLNTPSPAGFIRKNFDAVFDLFGVAAGLFNPKCDQTASHCELSKELSGFASHRKLVVSFLEAAQDSFRSQQFVLDKLARLKIEPEAQPKSSLLDCLPRIQEILADMRHLEDFRARGEHDQSKRFKLELVTKVQTYLEELAKQKVRVLNGADTHTMDASLVDEYKQQLEGILEVLSQSEPETHSVAQMSQKKSAQKKSERADTRRMSRSRSFSQKTYSSNNLSLTRQEREKHLFRPPKERMEETGQFRPTGGFVCGEIDSDRTNRTTIDQKLRLGPRNQNQRFTFKQISSEQRRAKRGSDELRETLGKAEPRWKGEDYCRKFNEAQVKLFREKIKRKRDLLRNKDNQQKWKERLLKGESNADNLELQNEQFRKAKEMLRKSRDARDQLEKELENARDELERKEKRIGELGQEMAEMRSEDQRRKERFAREKEELEGKLRNIEANVNKMRGQMEERRERQAQRSREREKWREEREQLREHLAGVEKDNVFLAEKLTQLKEKEREQKQEKSRREEKEAEDKKREQGKAEQVVEKQRREIEALKAELAQMRREMGRLEEEVVFTKGTQLVERKTLDGLKRRVDKFQDKREKWRKKKAEHGLIEREKRRLERVCLELEEAAKRDQDQLRRARAEVEEQASRLRILRKKVERLEEQVRAHEKEILYLELGKGKRKGDIQESRGKLTKRGSWKRK